MASEFRLPELGENIESGVVAKVLVAAGQTILRDQPLLELETDKAVIEVPSPLAGTIKQIFVRQGEKAAVGQLILTIVDGVEPADEETGSKHEEPPVETASPVSPVTVLEERAASEVTLPKAPTGKVVEFGRTPQVALQPQARRVLAPAAPSVRRLARELGVEISQVSGSGPGGRISIQDVKNHARRVITETGGLKPAGPAPTAPLPDFARWGEIERTPMTTVRRKTAENMSYAWATVPHVTQFDKADITELEELRKSFGKKAEAAGGKLTVTAIMLKIVASALKVFPQFNASLDMSRNDIVFKKYYHIGVAVDTDRGLLVPVIRDVDKKNILELSVELTQMAERARNKKLSLDEMQGGTFTITNLGGIGGTYFSPIVNAPDVAILGISRASVDPVFVNGQFEPRLMLPLSLSYDHRLIDGADAARFLHWVVEALQQPFLIALEG
jgi:pyruvate dehydrogenase E2 component (dihydrolipoamide acetyltransferase)